ncbi:ubiquitin carboxyl-terminal hydrolase 2-like [Octopus sinensis]|uniref:ubiquitinyl hydrolase 1 n=1 Tax=Octopus sinensis TaxID=2607531 RepID=A0A7E6EJA1_9MOLL|nr:ubiquitin carboxyl-terminal hydrolase 2-like [Octopus sinensis]
MDDGNDYDILQELNVSQNENCYMNSVLQCLVNTPRVAKDCLLRPELSEIQFNGSLEECSIFYSSLAFCELVKEMWSSSTSGPCCPRDFKMEINMKLRKFIEGNNTLRYNLYGVINHYGSLNSGHYTAFCRSCNSSDIWFLLNDSRFY